MWVDRSSAAPRPRQSLWLWPWASSSTVQPRSSTLAAEPGGGWCGTGASGVVPCCETCASWEGTRAGGWPGTLSCAGGPVAWVGQPHRGHSCPPEDRPAWQLDPPAPCSWGLPALLPRALGRQVLWVGRTCCWPVAFVGSCSLFLAPHGPVEGCTSVGDGDPPRPGTCVGAACQEPAPLPPPPCRAGEFSVL